MTHLEQAMRDFQLVSSGINQFQGGFSRTGQFSITGGSNTTVEGSLKHGFSVCATCPPEQIGPIQGLGPPPFVCPSTVTVTPHGVTFCCFNDGFGNSFHLEDIGFNDVPVVATLQTSDCFDCIWLNRYFEQPPRVQRQDFEAEDCASDPTTFGNVPIDVWVGKLGSTYYALIGLNDIIFLGSGTDPSHIDNTAFCSTSTSWDNIFIECILGSPITGYGLGTGGYVEIVL